MKKRRGSPTLCAMSEQEPGAPLDPFGALQLASADWSAGGGDGAAQLEAALLGLSPLLGPTYLLEAPNVAGMGVGAWDLARPVELGPTPEKGLRRMVGASRLKALLGDDEPPPPGDPEAPERAADLVEAMQRLDEAAGGMPQSAPEAVIERLGALRRDLERRLRLERRHHPALAELDPSDPDAPSRLRALRRPTVTTPAALKPARGPSAYDQDPERAVAEAPPAPEPGEVARLAAAVAKEAGIPAAELVRRARATKGGGGPAAASGPISVARVAADGTEGPGGRQAVAVLNAALRLLPELLRRRAGDAPRRGNGSVRVDLEVDVHPGETAPRARALADRLADALLGSGYAQVDELRVGVTTVGGGEPMARQALFDRIADGDAEAVASLLRTERRTLDGALRERLAAFFGHDFADVMVFAGPMAGALARSIRAEAFTHGKMVFFDPKHYRPDTPKGEALVAHELAHTRQEDDRDARIKEAEALSAEAAWLDWIQPGGVPLVEDNPLEPTRPDAAAAADFQDGVLRATAERKGQTEAGEGPRAGVAEHEQRVKEVLEKVRELLERDSDVDGQRLGRLDRFFVGPI